MVQINNVWPPTSLNFCGRKTLKNIFLPNSLPRKNSVHISFNASFTFWDSIQYLYRQTEDPQYWIKGLRAVGFTVFFSFSRSYHTSIYWAEVGWRQVQFPSLLRGVIKFSWCWEKEILCDEHSKTWLASLWDRISTTSKAELPKHLQKTGGLTNTGGGKWKEIEI